MATNTAPASALSSLLMLSSAAWAGSMSPAMLFLRLLKVTLPRTRPPEASLWLARGRRWLAGAFGRLWLARVSPWLAVARSWLRAGGRGTYVSMYVTIFLRGN